MILKENNVASEVQCKEAEKSCYIKTIFVFSFHLTQVRRDILDTLMVPSKLKPGILKECYYQKLSMHYDLP